MAQTKEERLAKDRERQRKRRADPKYLEKERERQRKHKLRKRVMARLRQLAVIERELNQFLDQGGE